MLGNISLNVNDNTYSPIQNDIPSVDEMSEDEMIDFVTAKILKEHRVAFEKL